MNLFSLELETPQMRSQKFQSPNIRLTVVNQSLGLHLGNNFKHLQDEHNLVCSRIY